MKRILLTIEGEHCPFGCRYCFARFTQYSNPLTLAKVRADPSALDGVEFIYPACDTDLFARPDAVEHLWEVASLNRSICVSTKARISMELADSIAKLNECLRGKGLFIKIGVSFSTKRSIASIEPRTASYEARLAALAGLAARDVPTSVILKPLLAEVPTDEYLEIIAETCVYTRAFVVGDEYLDVKCADLVGLGRSRIERRQVGWAHGKPTWPVRITSGHVGAIRELLLSRGLEVYESDLDLMMFLQTKIRNTAGTTPRPALAPA